MCCLFAGSCDEFESDASLEPCGDGAVGASQRTDMPTPPPFQLELDGGDFPRPHPVTSLVQPPRAVLCPVLVPAGPSEVGGEIETTAAELAVTSGLLIPPMTPWIL